MNTTVLSPSRITRSSACQRDRAKKHLAFHIGECTPRQACLLRSTVDSCGGRVAPDSIYGCYDEVIRVLHAGQGSGLDPLAAPGEDRAVGIRFAQRAAGSDGVDADARGAHLTGEAAAGPEDARL